MIVLFIVFASIALIVHFHVKLWRQIKFAGKMDGPLALPIFGNLDQVLATSTEEIVSKSVAYAQNYTSPTRIWLGPILLIYLNSPEDFQVVINNPNLLQKSIHYDKLKIVLPEGLFSTRNLAQWKMHRKIITSSLAQKSLNGYVDSFYEISKSSCDDLDTFAGQGVFNIFMHLFKNSVDAVTETILSCSNTIPTVDVCNMLHTMLDAIGDRVFNPWLYFDIVYKYSPRGRIYHKTCSQFREYVRQIITAKRQEYRHQKEHHLFDDGKKLKPTMDMLIEVSEEQGILTDEQICDEIVTLIFGGSDSSANTNGFCLMLLGMHEDIQDKVYEELVSVFGDSNRPITYKDLPHLKLLERVIKETMRLYPVGPLLGRLATEDIELKNATIPKGCQVILNIIGLHRNPEYWKDPLKFDPDRFLPENFAKLKPCSYVPFSVGPRNCVGSQFAMMSMKVTLATFLRRYKVKCDVKRIEDIKIKTEIMIAAVDGHNVSIEKRM